MILVSKKKPNKQSHCGKLDIKYRFKIRRICSILFTSNIFTCNKRCFTWALHLNITWRVRIKSHEYNTCNSCYLNLDELYMLLGFAVLETLVIPYTFHGLGFIFHVFYIKMKFHPTSSNTCYWTDLWLLYHTGNSNLQVLHVF